MSTLDRGTFEQWCRDNDGELKGGYDPDRYGPPVGVYCELGGDTDVLYEEGYSEMDEMAVAPSLRVTNVADESDLRGGLIPEDNREAPLEVEIEDGVMEFRSSRFHRGETLYTNDDGELVYDE